MSKSNGKDLTSATCCGTKVEPAFVHVEYGKVTDKDLKSLTQFRLEAIS